MIDEISKKLHKEFQEKNVWIVSFYKKNEIISIADSHFDDEITVESGYEFSKELSLYNLKLEFKVSKDFIYYIVNGVEVEMEWNKDSYIQLPKNKQVWICTRRYK